MSVGTPVALIADVLEASVRQPGPGRNGSDLIEKSARSGIAQILRETQEAHELAITGAMRAAAR